MLVTVPGKLRPGQMSVVTLGRVIIGDVAVTLIDLAERGRVELTQAASPHGIVAANADWVIHVPSRPTQAAQTMSTTRQRSIVAYEKTLLDGLSGYKKPTPLTVIAGGFGDVMDKVRSEIVREAVRQGWLRRWHHDQRTDEGEQLAHKLRAFRGELRRLKAEQGEDALISDWLPFAVHFGLVSGERVPLARFARAWDDAFSGLKGWQHQGDPWRHKPYDEIPMGNPPGSYY